MTGMDAIQYTLALNDNDMRLFEDMRDAPLTQPTGRGGNHPLWILGHLALNEAAFHSMISGEANDLERWQPLFGTGTIPSTDPSAYPSYDEVFDAYRRQRARNLALLQTLGDAGLDRPPKSPPQGLPPGAEALFDTNGRTLLMMAAHHAYHCGQIAVTRRAAGRNPFI